MQPEPGAAADAGTVQHSVRLQLLGPPCLTALAQVAPQHLAAADAALLARLALDGPQLREALAALLWPDNDPARAATNLRQRIHRLKRIAGVPVVVGARTLALGPAVQHDLHGEQPCETDTPTPGFASDPALGRLLGSHEYPDNEALTAWVARHREQRAQHRARRLDEHARALAAQGKLPAAVQQAQTAVSEAPLDEPAHRLLIQLLHQSGQHAAALAAYRRLETALADELGCEPSPATRLLWQQLQVVVPPAPTPAPGRELPLSLLRPPRRVDRDDIWQAMAGAASTHQALLLVAEAGMGKTRLLSDFVAATPGWLRVTASAGDRALPFALLARALSACSDAWGPAGDEWVRAELARLVPAAGEPATDAFVTLRLQQAVGAALRHWHQQGLAGVALDDLHFADGSSLALLAPLVTGAAAGMPCWLLGTRPTQLAAALEGVQTLSLPPLSMTGLCHLLDTLMLDGVRSDEWAPVLQQRTGGNPLFVLQLLSRAFESGGLQQGPGAQDLRAPLSLASLLSARLDNLSPQARSIVRLAAVAGPDFTLALACELLQATPAALADPWLELQRAHVMNEGHFAHDLVREASHGVTPTELRLLMHAQVAAALTQRGAPAARVAQHWDAAGRWPEAAANYESAAAAAHTQSAWLEELLALQAAIRCHRATATRESEAAAFATELRAFDLRVTNTQLGDDTRASGEALLARAQGAEQRAGVLVVLAYYWAERYEPAQALPLAQEAQACAQACANPRLLRLASQRLGGALSRLGRPTESLDTFRALAADLSSLSAIERLNWLGDFGAALNHADERAEALDVLTLASDSAMAQGLWSVAAAMLSTQGVALGFIGRLGEALQATEQALALYRRAGVEGAGLLIDETTLAGHLRDLGRFGDYLGAAQTLPQALRDAGSEFWAANAEHDLAVGYAWLGRADLALRTLAPRAVPLPPLMQAARLVTRARLAHDYGVGSAASASTWLQDAAAVLTGSGTACPRSFSLAIELHSARGAEPALALATAARIERLGLQSQNLLLACSAACIRLRLLLDQGDGATAAQVASDWLQRTAAHGPPAGTYAPELWWLACQALQTPQLGLARDTLQHAAQWLRRTAREQVPDVHRSSFLNRNPINRAILAQAQRLGL